MSTGLDEDAGESLVSVAAIEKANEEVDKDSGDISVLLTESEVVVEATPSVLDGESDVVTGAAGVDGSKEVDVIRRNNHHSNQAPDMSLDGAPGVTTEGLGGIVSEAAEVIDDFIIGGARVSSLVLDGALDTSLPNEIPLLKDTSALNASPLNISLPDNDSVPPNNRSIPNDAPNATSIDQSIVQPTTSRLAFHHHSTFTLPGCSDGSNFCRDVQWCSDGGSVLAVLEDASVVVLDVEGEEMLVKPRLPILQAAPVLSTAWFPSASPTQPASYCFVAAVRDGPIKLLDASDGRLRASYKIVDHRERFIAPHSMAFNMYMNKLYCGFEDAIEVFDVNYAGAVGTRLHTVPTKKSRDGLRGLISALAFAPDWSGLYAAGSYSGAVALYTEDTGVQAQGWLGGVPGGVTQIRFNPAQPHVVHAAFRRTSAVASWDLRNPSEPVGMYDRGVVETNQRLRFDVSPDGRWIVAGDERGVVSVFDVHRESHQATSSFTAHGDAIGAVAFHPTKPYAISVSGSRHFDDAASENSSSTDESSDMEDAEVMRSGSWRAAHGSLLKAGKVGPTTLDSSLKLWSCGGI